MRWARGLVLLLAAGSAIGAALIVHKTMPRAAPAPAKAALPDFEVLVTVRAIAAGEMVEETALRWQPWPAPALPPGSIRRKRGAAAPAFTSAPARYPLLEGEPVAEGKLARPGDGGVMAGLLAPGKRAVAIPMRDESAAGGFIQPNDRVDVIWTRRAGDSGKSEFTSRTLLRRAKVLAIGKALQARGNASADGRTATLELTPGQARIIADARAGGDISLALVSAADSGTETASADEADGEARPVQMLKFGRPGAAQIKH